MGFGYGSMSGMFRGPRVIPNPMDNTLLIQSTPQEWEQIQKLLIELDIPPRQVLIEAKVYEVNLNGALAGGVTSYLQMIGAAGPSVHQLLGSAASAGLSLSAGMMIGRSRELMSFLSAQESSGQARIISNPSVLATDSIAASINVGQDVPTLAAQAVSPVQGAGTNYFTNTIQNRSTGVSLNIMARVNPSGIVTMMINQEVSAPQAPPASAFIQSPSFTKRNVQTQVTVSDGDTVAIGGIIQETEGSSSAGVPFLNRIPGLGLLFGAKSINKARTELIVFLTPRVVYDTNQIAEATEELKSKLRKLSKYIQE